jgi:hypothetical protein
MHPPKFSKLTRCVSELGFSSELSLQLRHQYQKVLRQRQCIEPPSTWLVTLSSTPWSWLGESTIGDAV